MEFHLGLETLIIDEQFTYKIYQHISIRLITLDIQYTTWTFIQLGYFRNCFLPFLLLQIVYLTDSNK